MTNKVLDTIEVPVADVKAHSSNARKGNIEMIKESLQENGQYRSIVVNVKTMECLAGNHTLMAARELGWETVLASMVEVDEAAAKRILLVDNRANDVSGYDDELLGKLLEEMMLQGALGGTGYTPDDVDDFLSDLDSMPESEASDFEGDHAVTEEELGEHFKNRTTSGPQRQFVLMYPQEVAAEVEARVRKLQKQWGMTAMTDVVLNALRETSGEVEVPKGAGADAGEPVDAEVAADIQENTVETSEVVSAEAEHAA